MKKFANSYLIVLYTGMVAAFLLPFAFSKRETQAQEKTPPALRPNQNGVVHGPYIDIGRILLGQFAILTPDSVARSPIPFEKICLQGTAYWMQRDGLTAGSLAVVYVHGKVETCSLP